MLTLLPDCQCSPASSSYWAAQREAQCPPFACRASRQEVPEVLGQRGGCVLTEEMFGPGLQRGSRCWCRTFPHHQVGS